MSDAQAERLRQLKQELNAIKNSNLTDSQFLTSMKTANEKQVEKAPPTEIMANAKTGSTKHGQTSDAVLIDKIIKLFHKVDIKEADPKEVHMI